MGESTTDRVQAVRIEPGGLEAMLGRGEMVRGVVLFAHGSGSGRFSPRNNFVAAGLRRAGCATLLLDLLRPEEEADRSKVFDIRLLADRLLDAGAWVRRQEPLARLPLGLFGASTGAGAALVAAADAPEEIAAVVSRGGRPDLAGTALPRVQAPTLLIVGSLDTAVIELNRQALAQLTPEKKLAIVPGATHLFEETGTLEQVLELATAWFVTHFNAPSA
jgi:putative phosphoribosyl transferase